MDVCHWKEHAIRLTKDWQGSVDELMEQIKSDMIEATNSVWDEPDQYGEWLCIVTCKGDPVSAFRTVEEAIAEAKVRLWGTGRVFPTVSPEVKKAISMDRFLDVCKNPLSYDESKDVVV